MREELEKNFNLKHTAEGFVDGLGLTARCRRWCWLRRSFFREDLSGEDWFVNSDFEKLNDLVNHLLDEAHKPWAATVL